MVSTIITIIIVLCVIGFALWLINNYVPVQAPFKQIINFVVILGTVIWLIHNYLHLFI